jgi:hypothetical protein
MAISGEPMGGATDLRGSWRRWASPQLKCAAPSPAGGQWPSGLSTVNLLTDSAQLQAAAMEDVARCMP